MIKLSKKDVKNMNSYEEIENELYGHMQNFRKTLYGTYEHESELCISVSKFRCLYKRYNYWSDWKYFIMITVLSLPLIVYFSTFDSGIRFTIAMSIAHFSLAMGLYGLYIRIKIKKNFKEVGLENELN
jgi:hypothetical protein